MQLQPTSFQAPGYPCLLLTLWKMFGNNAGSLLWLSLLQAMLVSSIVYPMGWLTRRWVGTHAAPYACWVSALLPPYAYFATRLSQTSIIITLYPWLVVGWLFLADKKSWRSAVLLGIATGLASLFQPVMLGVFGLLGMVLLARTIRQKDRPGIRCLCATALVVVLVLLPWTIRNYRVQGCLVLIKNTFGKELWIGNNPQATGVSVQADGRTDMFLLYLPKALQMPATVTEMEVMRHMQADALTFIHGDIPAFLQRTGQKILWFWTSPPLKYLPMESARHKFYWLQQIYWWLLLALAGISLWRIPREYAAVCLIIGVVYSVTFGLTFVDHSRFRADIEFILIPAAAATLARWWMKLAGGMCGNSMPAPRPAEL